MAEIILEEISRALVLLMKNQLSTQLAIVEAEMAVSDQAYYAALGQVVPDTPLVAPNRWEYGFHPSIVEMAIEDYPVMVVMCYDQESASDLGSDQYEVLSHAATVEMAAIHADIQTMNRIALRNAKAIHRVILGDRTLGGLTRPISLSPSVTVSLTTSRRIDPDRTEQTYVQACLLEYSLSVEQPW